MDATGITASIVALLCGALIFRDINLRLRWRNVNLPGPPRYPLIGSLIVNARDIMDMFKNQSRFGTVSAFFPLNNPIVLTSDPEDFKRIFTTNIAPKGSTVESLGQYLGPSGIVFLDHNGPEMTPWKTHRQAIDQAFRVSSLRSFQHAIQKHAEDFVQRLESQDGKEVDMVVEFRRIVLNITSELVGAGDAPAEFLAAMTDLIWSLDSLLIRTHLSIGGIYLKWLKRRSFKIVDNFLNEAIRAKQAELARLTDEELLGRQSNNLLELLLLTGQFTPKQIRDHLVIFYLAGLDTAASLLPSALFQIVQHPDVCRRAVAELGSVRSPLAYDDLKKLRYTTHCVEESLRMRGPIIVTARDLDRDYELACGQVVPSGTMLLAHLHAVHFSEEWWTEPQKYNPSRFDKEENGGVVEPKHPFAYVPFAAGPRICIGRNLFFSEALTLLHKTLTRLSFEIIDHPDNGVVLEGHGLSIPKMVKFRVMKR
ncbi:cytochrome P450 [Jimgerdemannia flammicorona]|uniref:Cytochrome P450 n=2 Tax=Jimgerdemannia flammicorona TaxID=994334 RepID=A0A433DMC4_9FUNG|nr:cytochrome P450 [Jimgerdemannia flammicorona]RUS33913.1 cytochrome P450 [Jimgerdemannia flammicorona]